MYWFVVHGSPDALRFRNLQPASPRTTRFAGQEAGFPDALRFPGLTTFPGTFSTMTGLVPERSRGTP
jgi:hypothetical protein